MEKKKRKVDEINASSMADIAFLLLIFFLVATTMDVDTGMTRVLPPWVDAEKQKDNTDVNERNVLKVSISKGGRILVDEAEYTAADLIRNRMTNESKLSQETKTFLQSPDRSDKKDTLINGQTYPMSEGVVSLKADKETQYKVYIDVQNELTHAFNDIREDYSQKMFKRPFDELDSDERTVISKLVPMRISEAEPNDQTKKKYVMAVMAKKGKKEVPKLSTSSLPDVIFMILFFFMVSTSMREKDVIVTNVLPQATEITKLDKKNLISIYVGVPLDQQNVAGSAPRIQLNDSFQSTAAIRDFIASEVERRDEAERSKLTVNLRVDENSTMGIVTDVKQELRKAQANKISYAARQK